MAEENNHALNPKCEADERRDTGNSGTPSVESAKCTENFQTSPPAQNGKKNRKAERHDHHDKSRKGRCSNPIGKRNPFYFHVEWLLYVLTWSRGVRRLSARPLEHRVRSLKA